MRTPLAYQPTRFDCGPTTLTNALRYLYEREELDPELLTTAVDRTLDSYNTDGEYGKQGTSHYAIRNVINHFHIYGAGVGFPIDARIVNGQAALIAPGTFIYRALEAGAVAVARVWHNNGGHYILLTGVENGRVLAFDPSAGPDTPNGDTILEVSDQPERANRSIDTSVFNQPERGNYVLKNNVNAESTDPDIGELGLIWRTDNAAAVHLLAQFSEVAVTGN